MDVDRALSAMNQLRHRDQNVAAAAGDRPRSDSWVRLVHLTLKDCEAAESADGFCERQPQLLEKTRLQLFYSRERLMSWEAKREFVEPDLGQFK